MTAIADLRRFLVPVLVLLMVAGAAWTYQTKHHAVVTADHVIELRRLIEDERTTLSLLKAEWGELTQPGRIQDLATRHLDYALEPFGIDRMVHISDIPFSPNHDFIADMVAANSGMVRP